MTSTTDGLIEAARAVRSKAYAPYSQFLVGAAVRTVDGAVYSGCNVENAAYPEGTCAEAGALAAMCAAGGRRITEVAVVVDADSPATPCGGCRQKLLEFGSPDVPVIMVTLSGERMTMTLGELLPGAFNAGFLD